MGSVKDIYTGGDLLKGDDMPLGRDVALTITELKMAEFDDGKKLVASFHGTDKRLSINYTNAMTIVDLYGEDYDRWIGKRIILYRIKTTFQGRQVAAIRIREAGYIGYGPPHPPPLQPQPLTTQPPQGWGTGAGWLPPEQPQGPPQAAPLTDDDIPF